MGTWVLSDHAGDDIEAVAWLRRSIEANRNHPVPHCLPADWSIPIGYAAFYPGWFGRTDFMAWPGSEVDQQERGSKAIRLEDAMSMSVESILRQKGADVATIVPEASVKRATSWLHAKNVGSLVVTSGNAVVGLISEREIVHAIARYGETATSMPVSEIMRRGVITVSPTDTVSHVMSLMTRHRVRHMPVLRDGNLVGIISIGDVVKHRLDDLELENKVLRDAYVVGR